MTAYRQSRRDERRYRAIARQIIAVETRPGEYAPPIDFIPAADRARAPYVDYVSWLPGARNILDLVDAWHAGDGDRLELHEYLGLTRPQYATWVTGGPLPAASLLYDGDRTAYRNLHAKNGTRHAD